MQSIFSINTWITDNRFRVPLIMKLIMKWNKVMWFDWCLEFSLHWLNICFWTSHRDYLFMTRSHTCYAGFTLPLFLSLVINRMHGMVKHTNTSYHYIYILYIDYFRIVLRMNIYDIFYKKNELIFSLFYKTQPRIQ